MPSPVEAEINRAMALIETTMKGLGTLPQAALQRALDHLDMALKILQM